MFQRTLVVPLLAACALAAGCASDGGAGGGTPTPTVNDAAGQEPLPGIVRIAKVDRAPDGKVTYYLENVSGKLQEDLACRVNFLYAPTGKGAIAIADDWEPTALRDLVLLKGDTAKEVAAENPRPGQPVKATTITVENTPPVAAVMREGNQKGTGTLFLNRALECVGMASEDEVHAGKLWIEVENVSNRKVSDLEARAVFVDSTGEKKAETKWTRMADLQPGARGRIAFDLSGLGRVGTFAFLVKVRQQTL